MERKRRGQERDRHRRSDGGGCKKEMGKRKMERNCKRGVEDGKTEKERKHGRERERERTGRDKELAPKQLLYSSHCTSNPNSTAEL